MIIEIVLAVMVLAVALLVMGDVVKTTKSYSSHEYADGLAYDDRPQLIRAPRGHRAGEFPQPPAGTGIPVAHDVDPARRAENVSPPAGPQHSGATSAERPEKSGPALQNWLVRSRLMLLVIIPAVAVAVAAFCVVRMANTLQSAQIDSSINSVRDRAIVSALVAGVAAVIVLALAGWFAFVAARSVLRPLRRLQAGALEVTGAGRSDEVRRVNESANNNEGVPSEVEPINVDSADEIGDIARAFNQMRRETLRLAASETALRGNLNAIFVNLSHRSQSLMERQIRLIENLKQGERDTEHQVNLARIDQIAARMHRNSQNLLVLAGHQPSGQWNQPMALASVIRVAVSQVEEDERISLNAQPDIAVCGPAVNDVAHLLAELVENAAAFSAADMPVDISGRLMPHGGALIGITDRGVGMGTKEMAYANWQLENPPAADVNASKWMGLFVVGTLAARHGIRVRLEPAEFGGLTALVWLPDEVITQQVPATSPGLSGFVGARPRPAAHERPMDSGRTTAQQRVAVARPMEFSPRAEDAEDARPARWRQIADAKQRSGPASPADSPQPDFQAQQAAAQQAAAQQAAATRPSGTGWSDPTADDAGVAGHAASALADEAAADTAGDISAQGSLDGPGLSVPSGSRTSQFASDPLALNQQTRAADAGVIVPPAGGPGEKRRLPIFDAVESSWFRGGRLTPGPSVTTSATGSRWSSPADEGWQAAEAAHSPSIGGPTTAGLPQRLPNANLVPGAIPSAQPVMPKRSAAAARDRLAKFQRGVNEGRAATSEVANPGGENESLRGSCRAADSGGCLPRHPVPRPSPAHPVGWSRNEDACPSYRRAGIFGRVRVAS